MGDGTADGAGKGESRVESEAGELGGLIGLDLLDDGIDLGRAGRLSTRHLDGRIEKIEGRVDGTKREKGRERKRDWCLGFFSLLGESFFSTSRFSGAAGGFQSNQKKKKNTT